MSIAQINQYLNVERSDRSLFFCSSKGVGEVIIAVRFNDHKGGIGEEKCLKKPLYKKSTMKLRGANSLKINDLKN